MLRQSQFDSLLTPVLYHHFELGQTRVPTLRQRLFNVQRSNTALEYGTGLGGMAPEAWDLYKESGNKGKLDMDQLYTQTYTHIEYPVQLSIEKRLLLNDQYNRINTMIQRAGQSAATKMEVDAASLLNNAFSSSYTWSDAVALCSASHPKSKHKSAGTQSNKGTSAMTKDVVAATRIAMMKFTDDKGNILGVMPNELWVPPELEDTALEIVGSVLDPASANNAINAQAGRFTVIPWARLSDTNNWFMADSVMRQQAANWYEREALEVMMVDESTTHVVYELKLHYSFGVDDWRWIYGHEVA